MRAFMPAAKRAVVSVRAMRAYATALRTLDTYVNKRADCGDESVLHEAILDRAGPYQLAMLYSFDQNGWGKLNVIDSDGSILLCGPIDSHSRYRRFMLSARKPGPVRVTYTHSGGLGGLTCHALGLESIAIAPNLSHAPIRKDSVCASIATYPQRRAMLGDTVASLVPQVDYVFVYLNNYTSVPHLQLSEQHQQKLHFILDTNSRYRAAAKFAWLDRHKCYWLVCDDDIIYPHDYASSMIAQVRRHGNRAIVGVHATVFDEAAPTGRKELPFQFELKTDERVHMLGTGTIALHSYALPREICNRLLRYPIENDEILAVLCKRHGIPQIAVNRRAFWLKSNPKMKYGIYEETQLNVEQSRRVRRILGWGDPWPKLDSIA